MQPRHDQWALQGHQHAFRVQGLLSLAEGGNHSERFPGACRAQRQESNQKGSLVLPRTAAYRENERFLANRQVKNKRGIWWAAQDSNLEPGRYERHALPLS